MSSHTPYIMPDGGKLGGLVLRGEGKKSGAGKRGGLPTGKQAQADLVSAWTARARSNMESGHALSGQELVELRALESVGVRRRRRW